MCSMLDVNDVIIGFHPDGYRIDKTASALNRYTKWEIQAERKWSNPKPVCFHSLPTSGWMAIDKFDWDEKSDSLDQDL